MQKVVPRRRDADGDRLRLWNGFRLRFGDVLRLGLRFGLGIVLQRRRHHLGRFRFFRALTAEQAQQYANCRYFKSTHGKYPSNLT